MYYIEKTAIDYLPQPQGITGHPQFLWIMKSDKQNVKQTLFRQRQKKRIKWIPVEHISGGNIKAELGSGNYQIFYDKR